MRKSRFSEQRTVMITLEANTASAVEVAKKHGVSDPTIYLSCKRYDTLQADAVKRLRWLKQEYASAGDRRSRQGASADGASGAWMPSAAQLALNLNVRMPARDGSVLATMVSLLAQYLRFACWHIPLFLERQRQVTSTDQQRQLWRQAKLQVPQLCPRQRIATGRPWPVAPIGTNQVRAYDLALGVRPNWQ